jgi:hypothetical protein
MFYPCGGMFYGIEHTFAFSSRIYSEILDFSKKGPNRFFLYFSKPSVKVFLEYFCFGRAVNKKNNFYFSKK